MKRLFLLLPIFACFSAWAQDTAAPETTVDPPETAPPMPAEDPAIPDDGIRVAVLGYHDLAENLPETAMRIHTAKFRRQMEAIRQSGVKVLTLEEFTAWKRGDAKIPENSVMITFDDGWKSVYTDAFPILKEFGFPFTIFLYKNYVDGGGKALTLPMIREMTENGATIGSHSVSHPYPLTVKNYRKKGPDAYDAYLRKEIGESKRFLESKFPVKVTTYAYPGGFFTEEMPVLCQEFGYDFMFTVLPGKVKRALPDDRLPRYVILGNYDRIFENAMNFREGPATAGGLAVPNMAGTVAQTTPYPVTPEAGAIVNSRLPEISADLSTVADLDPATLSMKISGFGEVPATFDATTRKLSWQVNRRLREPTSKVSVTWKDTAGKALETPLRWTFQIDRESGYLPEGE
ncbi:MAG: polysaccharide deacetylase family protein [Luteolibacter sp.]